MRPKYCTELGIFATNRESLSAAVMNSPDWDNFMEHFTNENDNGYAWLNVNPLMFSIFRNYFHLTV